MQEYHRGNQLIEVQLATLKHLTGTFPVPEGVCFHFFCLNRVRERFW